MGKVLSSERGFASYVSRIESALSSNGPCIPWIEHFLIHCTRRSDFERTHEQRLMLKRKRTESKKAPNKGQIKTPPEAKEASLERRQDEKPVKPILHQSPSKHISNLFRRKKIVKFSSKVDVAERRSSFFGLFQRSEVPLGTPIVDPKPSYEYLDQDIDDLDMFCDETATHIVDGAIKDIRDGLEGNKINRMRQGTQKKTSYKKASGLYLKKTYLGKYFCVLCCFV